MGWRHGLPFYSSWRWKSSRWNYGTIDGRCGGVVVDTALQGPRWTTVGPVVGRGSIDSRRTWQSWTTVTTGHLENPETGVKGTRTKRRMGRTVKNDKGDNGEVESSLHRGFEVGTSSRRTPCTR